MLKSKFLFLLNFILFLFISFPNFTLSMSESETFHYKFIFIINDFSSKCTNCDYSSINQHIKLINQYFPRDSIFLLFFSHPSDSDFIKKQIKITNRCLIKFSVLKDPYLQYPEKFSVSLIVLNEKNNVIAINKELSKEYPCYFKLIEKGNQNLAYINMQLITMDTNLKPIYFSKPYNYKGSNDGFSGSFAFIDYKTNSIVISFPNKNKNIIIKPSDYEKFYYADTSNDKVLKYVLELGYEPFRYVSISEFGNNKLLVFCSAYYKTDSGVVRLKMVLVEYSLPNIQKPLIYELKEPIYKGVKIGPNKIAGINPYLHPDSFFVFSKDHLTDFEDTLKFIWVINLNNDTILKYLDFKELKKILNRSYYFYPRFANIEYLEKCNLLVFEELENFCIFFLNENFQLLNYLKPVGLFSFAVNNKIYNYGIKSFFGDYPDNFIFSPTCFEFDDKIVLLVRVEAQSKDKFSGTYFLCQIFNKNFKLVQEFIIEPPAGVNISNIFFYKFEDGDFYFMAFDEETKNISFFKSTLIK